MKRFLKSKIFAFILGAIIFGGIGVVATVQFQANEVGYRDTTVDRALDTLYEKANAKETICMKLSGTSLAVGSKYHCNLGENELRNFYVLKVDDNNNEVELIMEKNLSDEVGTQRTMTWNDANTFFNEGHPGYQTKQTWLTKAKEVKIPDVQTIAYAGGVPNWDTTTVTKANEAYFGTNNYTDSSKRSNYAWLYGYTKGCSTAGCTSGSNFYPDSDGYPQGYWTEDLIQNDTSLAWSVSRVGAILYYSTTDNIRNGVRPVIVVSKTSLAG